MSRVLIISDTHFAHRNVHKFRKEFDTADEHDDFVFNSIMQTVRKRDTLWMLGDIAFDLDGWLRVQEISKAVENLNIVIGNHDTDNAMRNQQFKAMVEGGYFHKVGSMFKLNKYWLTHSPIHPDELRGRGNIHGHTHNHIIHDERYINVCCERVDYKPVNLQDIVSGHYSTYQRVN